MSFLIIKKHLKNNRVFQFPSTPKKERELHHGTQLLTRDCERYNLSYSHCGNLASSSTRISKCIKAHIRLSTRRQGNRIADISLYIIKKSVQKGCFSHLGQQRGRWGSNHHCTWLLREKVPFTHHMRFNKKISKVFMKNLFHMDMFNFCFKCGHTHTQRQLEVLLVRE